MTAGENHVLYVPKHYAEALSFMSRRRPRGSGIDHWKMEPSGNYSEDCDFGAGLAQEYLDFIGKYPTVGHGTLLTCIVRDMISGAEQGRGWSGAHVGFLAGVNRAAMSAAWLMASADSAKKG